MLLQTLRGCPAKAVPLTEILARLWLEIGSAIHRLNAFRHPDCPAASPFTYHPTVHPASIHLT
jgi:hypothetical protein